MLILMLTVRTVLLFTMLLPLVLMLLLAVAAATIKNHFRVGRHHYLFCYISEATADKMVMLMVVLLLEQG